jgi:quinol monooxygenase YgiN
MIVVAGTVAIQPGKREDALRVARTMARATEAEPGCVRYRFYADVTDPDTFFVFEEWESEEALVRHFQTPHMRVFQQELPGFLAGRPDIRRYTVSASAPMG